MSAPAMLDEPRVTARNIQSPAQSLRANMAAVRISFNWMGTRKSLTPEQRAEAAQPFDAEGQYLSAGKKLLDTRHSSFKAVTAMSPLQYQKRLRLQEARHRLLSGAPSAEAVAYEVGYGSASQFSREYARLFGMPAGRDAARFRVAATANDDALARQAVG